MNKAKKEEYQSQLDKANVELKTEFEPISKTYGSAILTNVRDPQRVAGHLSKKFKNLKITVSYENGEQSIFAEPVLKQLVVDFASTHEQYIEQHVNNALAEVAKGHWPSFVEVAAFARGYSDGLGDEEMVNLRAENKRLKDDLHDMRRYMPPHPFMRMFPYGG